MRIFFRTKKYTSVLAIQFLEFALAALLLILSFLIAGELIYSEPFPFGEFKGILIFTMVTTITLILIASKKYFNFMETSFTRMLGKIASSVIIMNILLIIWLYFVDIQKLSLYYFITGGIFQIMFLILIKILSTRLKSKILRNKITLIIGDNGEKNTLIKALGKQDEIRLTFVSEEDEYLREYVNRADTVYLLASPKAKKKEEVIAYCELMDKRLFIVPASHEIAMRNSEMTQIGDIPLFAFEGFKLSEAQFMVKRLMDIILSLICITLTLPIVLTAGILIKREDGGPIFYKQVRTGLGGKEFKVIKLRSMICDAERSTGPVLAMENDPRITRIGHFIRAARIDEIPQFFNVLFGSMSIVGPRPERPVFVSNFTTEFPEYVHRLTVKPGITGLAQVLANYTTTAENKLKFDLVYIKEYSPYLDLKILLKTVKVIFSKEQSEGFSDRDKECTCDSAEEIEPQDLYKDKKEREFHKKFKVKKVFLILVGCIILITGSVLLRYSILAMNIVEALAQPVKTETGQVVGDADLQKEISGFMDNLTMEEKFWISSELIAKLSAKDLIDIEKLTEDGISRTERISIQNMLPQNFDSTKLNVLKDIITKE